jgi:RNA polymerase subunit RPABC4/transcription elongation factor Spt4
MTGHLVFTTLHTNSAVATVTRLINLGIPPYMVASGVQGVIAQRLVRRICPDCAEEIASDRDMMFKLGFSEDTIPATVRRGRGCASCDGQGYRGRLGLYEILVMDEDFQNLITTTRNETELTRAARAAGMQSLRDEGKARIAEGLTSPEELLRVLGPAVRLDCICEGCGRALRSGFVACPWCGQSRHSRCPSCASLLEENWVGCPYCGQTVGVADAPPKESRPKGISE